MKRSWIQRSKKSLRNSAGDKSARQRRRTLRVKRDSKHEVWRRAVLERDNGICQRCGKEGHHAHHVATRKRRPDLKYDVDNGICVCFQCHQIIHDHPKESAEQGWLSVDSYELAQKEAA